MNVSQLFSSLVQFFVQSPTLKDLKDAIFEKPLTATKHPVNPPVLGFYEAFLLSDGLLSCKYYSRYMREDNGRFARREILIMEIEDRPGELFVAFKNGTPTAWRIGLEKEYRPSITEQEIYTLKCILGEAQKAVAISAAQSAHAS